MFLVAVPFTVLAFVLSLVMTEIPLRTTSQMSTPDAGGGSVTEAETVAAGLIER